MSILQTQAVAETQVAHMDMMHYKIDCAENFLEKDETELVSYTSLGVDPSTTTLAEKVGSGHHHHDDGVPTTHSERRRVQSITEVKPKQPEIVVEEDFIDATNLMGDWPTNISSNFKFVRELGRGGFGRVWQCIRKSDKLVCACKIIMKVDRKQESLRSLIKEIKIYENLKHPRIIQLVDGYETKKKLYLFMDLCQGGELLYRITSIHRLKESDVSEIVAQILDVLAYSHALGVIHCDLKPENVMFVNQHSNEIKVIDFGLCKPRKRFEWCSRVGGTPAYIAPEALKKRYTQALDIWSTGIMTFEMLFGYLPFKRFRGNHYKTILATTKGFQNVVKPGRGPWFCSKYANLVSDKAKHFICACLVTNPSDRMTADEALAHEFITNPDRKKALSHVMLNLQHKTQLSKVQQFLRVSLTRQQKKAMNTERWLYKELIDVFEEVDVDKRGELTWEQFVDAIKSFLDDTDVATLQFDELCQDIDLEHTGKIRYNDVVSFCMYHHIIHQDDRLFDAILELDTDHDGKIDHADIETLVQENKNMRLSLNTVQELKKLTQDHPLEYSEFALMIEKEDNSSSDILGVLTGSLKPKPKPVVEQTAERAPQNANLLQATLRFSSSSHT